MGVVSPLSPPGAAQAFDYSLTSDGTTVRGYDHGGNLISQGADGGAVLTAILALLPAAGGAIGFRNDGSVFPWSTTPALPKGITRRLAILGNGALVQLSAAGPRFLDFNKTADYDTFQNIEIRDFVIDVNNLGGRHHVVLGTYINGTTVSRISVNNLKIDNVRTLNVPVDSTTTNHRLNVWIVPDMPAASAATSLTDINITNVRLEGGNMGVVVGATGAAAASLTVDRVRVDGWYHSLLSVQSAGFSSSNVQIGSSATVGTVVVANGFGQYSGDVGVEIDQAQRAIVYNVVIEDAINNCFYHTNISAVTNPNEQVIEFRGCFARKVATQTAGVCNGYTVFQSNSIAINQVQLKDCVYYANEPTTTSGRGFSSTTGGTYLIEGCYFVREGWTNTGNNQSPRNIMVDQGAGTTSLTVRDTICAITGTSSVGATGCNFSNIYLNNGTFQFTIENCRLSLAITSSPGSTNCPINLGFTNATTIKASRIVGNVLSNTVDTGVNGILVQSNVTIAGNNFLLVEENDFSGLAAAREITVATVATKQFIRTCRNVWKTIPAPVAFTSLVTATGKVLATMWDAMVVFTQGSGAAVTAVDFSTNGGTTYTNFLTQASAALPGGFSESLGPLSSDALVKVTFTTTQPTITLVPVNP